MAYASFSEFVSTLEKAGELKRISIPVATELEVTEVADREMKSPGGGKALLFEKIPAFEHMFRLLVQRSLSVLQQRLYGVLSQTAEERYLQFLEKYPLIAQRVPQHQIARYIGVSPEFLSKIRSTMVHRPRPDHPIV